MGACHVYVFLFVITGVIDLAACYFFLFEQVSTILCSSPFYFQILCFVRFCCFFFLFVCLSVLLSFIAYSSRKVISYKYVLTYLTYSFTGESKGIQSTKFIFGMFVSKQTYFNPDILTLVRNLVTGGVNQFLEEHIAEGDELRGGLDSEQTADTRSRCKILQLSLFEGPLAAYGVCICSKCFVE